MAPGWGEGIRRFVDALARGDHAGRLQRAIRLDMRVAFCQDGRLLSAVRGWMSRAAAGPDQPAWRTLVAQMTRQLVRTEGT